MDWFDSLRTTIPELTIAARLVLAASLGAVIGLEREYKNRDAGLRTHMLAALAAAVFTVITIEIFNETRSAAGAPAPGDPIRVIEAVTAGVAFLAAGAIIQSRGEVHGLTTGAAMWLAGAIGVACGGGYYTIAAMATTLALLILALLGLLERKFKNSRPEPTAAEEPRPRERAGAQ